MAQAERWERLGELSRLLQAFRRMYVRREVEEDDPSLLSWRRELVEFLKVRRIPEVLLPGDLDVWTATSRPETCTMASSTKVSLSKGWDWLIVKNSAFIKGFTEVTSALQNRPPHTPLSLTNRDCS